jgi:hypothetical protein
VDRRIDVSRPVSLPTTSVGFIFPVWSVERNYTIVRIHKSCDNHVLKLQWAKMVKITYRGLVLWSQEHINYFCGANSVNGVQGNYCLL